MGAPAWLWVVIFVLLALAVLALFNRMVRYRNRVREAWSGIDVQLKRRHNLVPRLVEAVKAYAAHERAVLEEVTRVRSETEAARDFGETEASEERLSRSLRPLLALVEAYPDLKANQSFLNLQQELVETEDMLQMARRYYNGSVRDFNTLIEMFPGNIVAGLFHFEPRDFFEIETATERLAPQVSLAMGQGE